MLISVFLSITKKNVTKEHHLVFCKGLLEFPNNQFSGTLPEKLYDLHNLLYLHGGNNKFSGELQPAIGMMSKLESISFRENR